MGLILTLVLGAFVGWIASVITNRDAEQGWVANILVGIVGAFLGGFISNALGAGDQGDLVFSLVDLFWATAGAVVLCLILNYVQRGRLS